MDGELRRALAYTEQAAVVAKELGKEQLLALTSNQIGMAFSLQGRFDAAVQMLQQAKTQFEQAQFDRVAERELGTWAAAWLGFSLAQRGEYAAGVAEGQRALAHAQQTHHPLAIATCHCCLSGSYLAGGDFPKALEASRAALKIAEEESEFQYVYMANCLVAWAETFMGEHQLAWETITRNTRIEQALGGRPPWSDIFTVLKGQIALNLGDLEQAVTLAQQGLTLAQARDGLQCQGWAQRVLGEAIAAMKPTRWEEVESHMAASLHALEEGNARPEAARTLVAWGNLCRERGDLQAARQHFEQAVAILEKTDLTAELEKARGLLAEV
jgi:tetratricopeptide (TPR) repeat protein